MQTVCCRCYRNGARAVLLPAPSYQACTSSSPPPISFPLSQTPLPQRPPHAYHAQPAEHHAPKPRSRPALYSRTPPPSQALHRVPPGPGTGGPRSCSLEAIEVTKTVKNTRYELYKARRKDYNRLCTSENP
jgi:hypothetical protein